MSEIRVGDLVVMVRGHECLYAKGAGIPFTVTELVHPTGGGWMCGYCQQRSAGPNEEGALGIKPYRATSPGNLTAIPISWLKRIPPLSQLDDVKCDEELTA